MDVQYIKMNCPECGKELKTGILCVNTPTNEFFVDGLEELDFYCDNCNITVYLYGIGYYVEKHDDK